MSIQAIAAALQKSTQPAGGNYFRRGRGIAELAKLTHKNGHKGESFIFDFKIVESEPLTGSGESPNPAGDNPAYVQNLKNEYAWPNIVQCVLALTGSTLADFEEAAKDSQYKAALVKANILGAAAPWGAAEEFEAFVKAAAETGALNGTKARYVTNNPEVGKIGADGKPVSAKTYVNFKLLEQ